MDESTTDAPVQDQATYESQPEEQHAEAENTPTSEPTNTNDEQSQGTDEPAQTENSDDDLADYWSKKGIDISTPEGQRAAAKSYREAEKAMHQNAQRSSELEKQLTSQPPEVSTDPYVQQLANEVFELKTQQVARDFIRENKLSTEQTREFAQWFEQNPQQQALVDNGWLTVDQAYKLSGLGDKSTEAIKSQGSRETLEKLANKQTASAVSGNAVTSAPPAALTKANADSWWESLGPAGRANPENRAKLDSVLG